MDSPAVCGPWPSAERKTRGPTPDLCRLTNAWTPSSGDCATSDRTVAELAGAVPNWTSYSYDAVGKRTGATQHVTAAEGGTPELDVCLPDPGYGGSAATDSTIPATGTLVGGLIGALMVGAAGLCV